MVQQLLLRLAESHHGWLERCVVTHNLPALAVEPPPGGWPFPVVELFNPVPKGFGANHNRAFMHCSSAFFCVLNPDVELASPEVWEKLVRDASLPGVGLAYPQVLNPDGTTQDNEREAVTPLALLRRHLLRQGTRRIDWVSGAFWVVPSSVYRRLGGFDERYFMYCEDVDFCLRLQLAGWKLAAADAAIIHDASWGSRRPGRHMAWHLRSLLRLWAGPPIRQYQARLAPA